MFKSPRVKPLRNCAKMLSAVLGLWFVIACQSSSRVFLKFLQFSGSYSPKVHRSAASRSSLVIWFILFISCVADCSRCLVFFVFGVFSVWRFRCLVFLFSVWRFRRVVFSAFGVFGVWCFQCLAFSVFGVFSVWRFR